MAAPSPPTPNTSLYVGDLDNDVSEATLFDVFRDVGPVLSIRVCRDASTKKSLGYAYVNFQNPLDAEKAIENLNHTKINGRMCRIMWCRRDPSLRKSGAGNVFIKNLKEDIDNKALQDTFAQFGKILSCKVVTDDEGKSRGYGFVHFQDDDAADKAVEQVNGMLLNDQQVFVGKFERKDKKLQNLADTYTNIYVKHFDPDCDEIKLRQFFESFGSIQSFSIQTSHDGTPKGVGFVNYTHHEEAGAAVDALNGATPEGIVMEGKELRVVRHQKKSERDHTKRQVIKEKQQQLQKYTNLYVKNLDDTVTSESLREAFNEYGTIMSCKVMTHPDSSVSKGFGFVCFEEADAAKKAMQEMNGRMLSGKPLYVTLAQKKDARKQHLELLYTANGGSRPNNNMMVGQGGGMMGQGGFGGMPAGPGMQMGGGMMGQGNFGYGMNPAARGMPMGGMPGMRQGGGGIGGMPGMRGPRHQFPVPLQQAGMGMGMLGQGGRPQQVGLPRPGMGAPQLGRQGVGMAGMMPPAAGLAMGSSGLDLDTARLATMPKEAQKNMLGERLYAKIKQTDQANAAKITGMLLEMDNAEILNLLDSPNLLQQKVAEALNVLRSHQAMR